MEPLNEQNDVHVDRRTAIKWVLAASAAMQLPTGTFAAGTASGSAGYGKDPDLIKIYQPDSLWPLTFNKSQRVTAAALCDMIIPADEHSPAASKVGVVDFLDEWISAPYPENQRDRPVVIDGLAWLDAESQRRFSKPFGAVSASQRAAICDDVSVAKPQPAFAKPAAFFARYRALTAGGFYTTPAGMKDLQFVGNVAMTTFDGPPAAVLKKLGLV